MKIPVYDAKSGKHYRCCNDVDREYGLPIGTTSRWLKKGIEPKIDAHICVPDFDFCELKVSVISGEEVWKPIPGYEGLYSISSRGKIKSEKRGTLKKVTTTKHNQHQIVLYKNSIPTSFVAENLYNSTFYGETPSRSPFKTSRNKPIKCVEDNLEFSSIKECCNYYKFDYKKFRLAMKNIVKSYGGQHFEFL